MLRFNLKKYRVIILTEKITQVRYHFYYKNLWSRFFNEKRVHSILNYFTFCNYFKRVGYLLFSYDIFIWNPQYSVFLITLKFYLFTAGFLVFNI